MQEKQEETQQNCARGSCSKGFKTMCGGQALIEGIMMRGPKKESVVVRRPDGGLEIQERELRFNQAPPVPYQASSPCFSGRTSSSALMPTSIMESSGSKVVKFCSHRPGATRMRVMGPSCRPAQRLNS